MFNGFSGWEKHIWLMAKCGQMLCQWSGPSSPGIVTTFSTSRSGHHGKTGVQLIRYCTTWYHQYIFYFFLVCFWQLLVVDVDDIDDLKQIVQMTTSRLRRRKLKAVMMWWPWNWPRSAWDLPSRDPFLVDVLLGAGLWWLLFWN